MNSREACKMIAHEIKVRTEGMAHGYKDVFTTKEQAQLNQHVRELDKMVRRLRND